MSEKRHQAITELADRILKTATAAYEAAPKIVLDPSDPSPPPLQWHVAFTAAQLLELFLRLCVLRGVQATVAAEDRPPMFDQLLERTRAEANRALKIFNIELLQEI